MYLGLCGKFLTKHPTEIIFNVNFHFPSFFFEIEKSFIIKDQLLLVITFPLRIVIE